MMGSSELDSLLEQCIQELQAGSNLEEILARHQKYAGELRPLLEMAIWTRTARDRIQVPGDAQSLSRTAFTNPQDARRRQPARSGFGLRLALSIAAVFIVLVSGLIGTTFASAKALPGDTLYPVKLAWEQVQINLASGTAQRLRLQANFDQQRVTEVSQLLTLGRTSNVTFSGLLASANETWNVAGININVPDQQTSKLPDLQNTVVKVTGETDGKEVKVNDIEPRLLTIDGQIQEVNPDHLQVSGVNVTLDKNTDIDGQVSVNQQVQIMAKESNDGELVAVTINGQPDASPTPTKPEQPAAGGNAGGQKNGSPENTPKPNKQEASPTPTEQEAQPTPPVGIQPMTISPTTTGTVGDPGGSENNGGFKGQSPTPTLIPGNSNPSGQENESQPTPTPTPTLTITPSSENSNATPMAQSTKD